jgi:hypothetical protein
VLVLWRLGGWVDGISTQDEERLCGQLAKSKHAHMLHEHFQWSKVCMTEWQATTLLGWLCRSAGAATVHVLQPSQMLVSNPQVHRSLHSL